jgi:hypothetical protein
MRDPHIHVDRKTVQAGADFRNVVASTLGHAPDAPKVVTTGCGQQAPYAMTSTRPESVTCLPCREHAQREYLKLADQIDSMRGLPGVNFTAEQVADAATRLRDIAKRFAG